MFNIKYLIAPLILLFSFPSFAQGTHWDKQCMPPVSGQAPNQAQFRIALKKVSEAFSDCAASRCRTLFLSKIECGHWVGEIPANINEVKSLNKFSAYNPWIKEFTALQGHRTLRELFAYRLAKDVDISTIKNIPKLEEIHLNYSEFEVFPILEGLPNLTRLILSHSEVSDIDAIKVHRELMGLALDHTNITSLEMFSEVTFRELMSLDVSHTNISDIEPIQFQEALRNLDISHTDVFEIKPEMKLPNLERLNLSHTKISDIRPLRFLQALRDVDISHTKVSNIKPFLRLPNLKRLNIRKAPISDLHTIETLRDRGVRIRG